MTTFFEDKSSIEEIRSRFDKDVERFSNLDTGQQTTLDAPFNMELITDVIAALYPGLDSVLDVGCGAGNYTLKLLDKRPFRRCTLNDLSLPMLERAGNRVQQVLDAHHLNGAIDICQGDIRAAALAENQYDVIMAAAVLHHLRDDADWEAVFSKLFRLLKPGGSLWIADLVHQEAAPVQQLVYEQRYGDYLCSLKDEHYRDQVFAYIEKEDSPRPLMYQIKLLEKVGFEQVEILHKHLCFASFGAIKAKS